VNESADIRISLASFCDFLSNIDVGVDSFVVDFVLSSRTSEVNDDVRVLDSFIVESVIIVVEITHNVALTRASAEFQFLDEIIISVDVVMRENNITANVAQTSTNLTKFSKRIIKTTKYLILFSTNKPNACALILSFFNYLSSGIKNFSQM
jgi:hypothetical protein